MKLGLHFRPRGRRAGRSVQQRASRERAMAAAAGRHLVQDDTSSAHQQYGQQATSNLIPIVLGSGRVRGQGRNNAEEPAVASSRRCSGIVDIRLLADSVEHYQPVAYARHPLTVVAPPRTLPSADRRSRTNQRRHLLYIPTNNKSRPPTNPAGQLSCYVVNSNRLVKINALQMLSTDIHSYDVDVAAVTETWLKTKHSDASFAIPGYTLFRCDRVGRQGGGVCCYTNNSLTVTQLYTSRHHFGLIQHHELLWLHIIKNHKQYLLAILYHPPKPIYNTNDFLARLDIDELSAQYPGSIIYLTGDFNKLAIANFNADNGL